MMLKSSRGPRTPGALEQGKALGRPLFPLGMLLLAAPVLVKADRQRYPVETTVRLATQTWK